MNSLKVSISPQYVKLTDVKEVFPDGKEYYLHEVQRRMKNEFEGLPEFTIITAPTGTGKSYAFPFPVLNSKKGKSFYDDSVRGLIVLPTNSLIDELTENFKKAYSNIVVNRLTAVELNERKVKGFERWETALEICRTSDIVITNPDLINYAMHGGYHKLSGERKTGGKEFHNFLELFDYLIFDEYHLYDESQIANILTLVQLRVYFLRNKRVRYLFVSATPEVGLRQIFEKEGFDFEEIIEEIVENPTNSRAIHGNIEVEFTEGKNLFDIVQRKGSELLQQKKNKEKTLIISNQLRTVHKLGALWQNDLPDFVVYESTGYTAKGVDNSKSIYDADIILATNKAEVGVNYPVTYCIMQTGKHFRNFIQRFGRVSRGNLDGKIIVLIEEISQFNRIRKAFAGNSKITYYEFLNLLQPILQDRKFYTDIVPLLTGEYIWCIENNLKIYQEFNSWQYLKRRMNEEAFFQSKIYLRYRLFKEIDELLMEGMRHALRKEKISKSYWDKEVAALKSSPRVREWVLWWMNYQDTYLSFRDNSKVISIVDKSRKEELNYSLDWILQHKELLDIERDDKGEPIKYIVGSLKEQEKDLQYEISTIPAIHARENSLVSRNEIFDLQRVFNKAVENIYKREEKGIDWINKWQVRLCNKVIELANTFSRKRIKIEDIQNNSAFL